MYYYSITQKLFFSFFILLLSCTPKVKDAITLNDKERLLSIPPNCKRIDFNFYADQTEVRNIDYKEYLHWLKTVHGPTSEIYVEAFPDTSVWKSLDNENTLHQTYFNHSGYDVFPVVGISLEQAKDYSKWRSERVTEMYLRVNGIIAKISNPSLDNHFTVQRYLEGKQDWILKQEEIFAAEYTIPTREEWEKIAGKKYEEIHQTIFPDSKESRKILKKEQSLTWTKERSSILNNQKLQSMPVQSYGKNIHGLYGIIGNVAELVDEQNISKGGSWLDAHNEVTVG